MKNKQYYSNLLREAFLDKFTGMFREPEGFLKRPFLDPSGGYGKQLWDWDSFLCTKSIFRLFHDPLTRNKVSGYRDKFIEHTTGAFYSFFDNQGKDGTIPMSMTVKKGDVFRSLDRNKGEETNMAKPVFGQYLTALIENTGDTGIAGQVFDKLLLFYECYRKNYLNESTGLFVWGSDVAIGVDDDPATWARPDFSSANIYLNTFMHMDLTNSAKIAKKIGRARDSEKLNKQAKELKTAIMKYSWDNRDGFFYTVDVLVRKHTPLGWLHKNLEPFWKCLPLKIMLWNGFLPMYAKICAEEQAKILVKKHLFNKNEFLSDYGIRALSRDEKMYRPEIVRENPSNWLGPVWTPPNYFIWQGLKNYGFNREADELAGRFIKMLGRDLEKTGTLHEYYSPESGKGLSCKDFWNWNMLVLFMMD